MTVHRIEQVSEENAHLVPDLVFSVYGHTYETPWMYDADRIKAAVRSRERLLFLALDDEGRARGCLGLDFPFPTRSVAFFCAFLVDPDVRGVASGFIFRDLAAAVQRTASLLVKEEGLRVIMSSEVTMHPLSQRYISAYGFSNCGIYLAWCPTWASRQRPGQFAGAVRHTSVGETQQTFKDRRAEVVSARVFTEGIPPYRVHFPGPFTGLLREIYASLGLPATENRTAPAPEGATLIEEQVHHLRSFAVIDVVRVGADAEVDVCGRIDHHCYGMADLIHIHLPLFQGDLTRIVQALLDKGCRFCAVVPVYREGDVLVLQYLNGVENRLTEDGLLSPLARRILRTAAAATECESGRAPLC